MIIVMVRASFERNFQLQMTNNIYIYEKDISNIEVLD